MNQIACINRSSLPDADVAFMAEACDRQVVEAAKAWDLMPWAVVYYATPDGLPRDCKIMLIVDSLDVQGALGYLEDDLGVIYGRVLNQGPVETCVTLSHECLEMLVDPTCTQWKQIGLSGRFVALEVCDPCQADRYAASVTIAGMSRDMWLSNFVTPRWFDAAGVGPFDRMQAISQPFEMSPGGYEIVRDATGAVTNEFAKTRPGDTEARLHLASKIAHPGSRTLRRLSGK